MRIAPIILRIRLANTRFGNNVGGAAELDYALKGTLKQDLAFVVPLNEEVEPNQFDTAINQRIREKFSVIVALANDSSDADKMGFTAYDLLHDIRSQIFQAILGWEIYGALSKIFYAGGQLLNINTGYLWYQFDFAYDIRLAERDGFSDIESMVIDGTSYEGQLRDRKQTSQIDDLLRLYGNYMFWPNSDLPYTGELPLSDGYPDVSIPNMAQMVTLNDDPNPGGFDRGYASGFDFYRILNRKDDPK